MTAGQTDTTRNHAAFIWSVADLLRGDYKQSEYGKVILPLTVLRRFDCVLAPTKDAVLERAAQLAGKVEVRFEAWRRHGHRRLGQPLRGWCVVGVERRT